MFNVEKIFKSRLYLPNWPSSQTIRPNYHNFLSSYHLCPLLFTRVRPYMYLANAWSKQSKAVKNPIALGLDLKYPTSRVHVMLFVNKKIISRLTIELTSLTENYIYVFNLYLTWKAIILQTWHSGHLTLK